MKGVVRVGKWRPIVGVCCLGMAFAGLSLQLEGSLPASSGNETKVYAPAALTGAVSNEALWARAGQIPAEGMPIFPAQYVNPYDDEPSRLRAAGLLKGALPLPIDNVVAGGCTFDIECEDTNPCTVDTCNINVPDGAGSGTCVNTVLTDGSPGECSDGLFCNGIEFCQAGACVDGPLPSCCANGTDDAYCTENLGKCVGGDTPDRRCSTDTDCGSGTCNHCQPVCSVNADCNDGLGCNGVETCSGGQCVAGVPPCGAGATCAEKRCIGQTPAKACNTEEDCNVNIPCNNSAGPLCFRGRCCSNVVEPVCAPRFLNQGAGATTCQGTGGKFFPGDAGLETGEANTCGGANPREPGTQFGCPKYSSGIEQLNVNSPPTHPVAAGPMSASTVAVPAPNGPNGALNRLGDDYTFTNSSHIELKAIRFVGFMSVPDAIFIEFWDASGNFIEDFLFRPSTGVGINLVVLEQPLVIPSSGRIAAVNKREFGMNSKLIWMSASGATTGTNNANVLFVNNNPNAANFMAPSPGVLAFELVGPKVSPPLGGCCKSDGSCTNELGWICDQLGGNFQGVGQFCNLCENGDNAGASCGRCVGGSNPGTPCNGSPDCLGGGSCEADDTVCNAGQDTCSNNAEDICVVDGDCPALPNVCSNADLACVLNSDCPAGGTCGGAGTCESGVCAALDACGTGACCSTVNGSCTVTTSGSCVGNFQGLGTSCEPNCCVQPAADTDCSDGICYTGADNCADAFVHVIPELPCASCGPGGTPADEYTVTITGDRTFASATEANPDSCWGVATTVDSDQGWWEAFSLTGDCTRIRFDYCCTSPTMFGDWAYVVKDCACNELLNNRADPYLELQFSANRGDPFCNEDNLWTIMGIMEAGTYYIPVNSTLEDQLGQYQLHIVAEACPTAACCLPNGSCVDGVNVLECEAQNGTFLAQPNRFPAVASCGDGSICDTGSCCVGPGQCEDEILGTPIDEADCTSLVGDFIGGLKCEGGTCADDPDYSCNDATDCPSGACNAGVGGARSLGQPNPCPVCQFESAANCQLYDNPSAFNYSIAELSIGSGLIVADDFIAGPTMNSISQVCLWGLYIITDPDAADNDCGETRTADNFRVRILGANQAGLPDNNNVVGSTTASSERGLLAGQASLTVWDPPVETYAFQLTLDNPIVGLVPGEKYFLEIANNLAPTDECFFWWIQLSVNSAQGNNFSAGGSDAGGYSLGAQREVDMSWCVDSAYDAPDPVSRPCCSCAGDCQNSELSVCNDALAEVAMDAVNVNGDPLVCDSEYQCPDVTPANDMCADRSDIYVGTHPLSILCSTTDSDGLNPVETDFGLDPLNFDVWYEFIAPQDCLMRVDMCATGDAFDSMIAVYSNGSGSCACPTGPGDGTDPTFIVANDEGCAASTAAGGSGFVEVAAQEGQCFVIRIGNWGPGNTRGVGLVDISCGDAFCGNNSTEASNGEECDGVSDSACAVPGSCNPPGHAQECQCGPVPVCGNNVREGNEQCDGTDSTQCPGLCIAANQPNECTCQSICGNGIKEGVEDCDGPADTSCGGEAGRCQVDCSCPAVECGNNFTDPGEECDGTDDLSCPGECRAQNDPAGECTCECGVTSVNPDPVAAESPAFNKVRHISFVVPATSAGTDTALRVQLTSLHHPSSPPPGTPNFAAHEGGFRYVNSFPGGVTTCVDNATFATNYRCGTLGCQPEYRDWATALASATNPASPAGLIHVTGDTVVPSSSLTVSHIAATCGAAPSANTCASASSTLAIPTSRWGDVGGGGGGPSDGAANVIDIGLVVDNVKGLVTAIPERRAWMKSPPNTVANPVNVIDIGLTVDAVKGLPYPYTIAACP